MNPNLKDISKNIRKDIVRMRHLSRTSHIGSSLSCADIIVSLYYSVINVSPNDVKDPARDIFILSKGHACSALYAVLASKGFFDKQMLAQYCANGSTLPGHSTINSVPGVEISTGSLGHGLPIAAGIALASKTDKKINRIYVLMSDGECEEGSVWEAAMFASFRKLDNITVIIDNNGLQAYGRTEEVTGLDPIKKKWEAFGWSVKEINGHDHNEIINTVKKAPFHKNTPSVIIAHTIKGKGISFMENNLLWHYKSTNEELFQKALKEIEAS